MAIATLLLIPPSPAASTPYASRRDAINRVSTPPSPSPSPSPLPPSTLPNPAATANQLLQQGNQHYQAGQLEAAIKSWQQARRLYQQLEDRQQEGLVLASLGAAHIGLEQYRDAIAILEALLPLAEWLDDRVEARALSNLGIAYKESGNYSQAIASHKQAGRLMRAIGNRQELGQVLVNLGNAFEAVGDYDNATIAYQQSLKIAEQMSDRVGEGRALGNLGAIYANLGKDKEAIVNFEQSLEISRSIKDLEGQASTLINLGSVYHMCNQRDVAIDYYQKSLAIARQIHYRQRESEALSSLGLAYEDLQDYPKAIEYHQQGLLMARSLNDPEAQGKALNNLGHTLFNAGKLADAEATLREAIQLLDTLRPGLSDNYRVSIFDTQLHTYNLLQQVLVAANQPEAALEATEWGRARAFVELLARRQQGQNSKFKIQNSKFPTVTPITIADIKQVARQQNATLVEYAIVPDDDFKFRGKQRAREAELFIWVVSPSGTVSFRRIDLKPLWQQQLTLAKLVAVSRGCLVPATDCAFVAQASSTNAATSQSPASLASQASGTLTSQRRKKNPALHRLHQLLIEPIADLLPKHPNARIVFIPQESLFLVPFPALQDINGTYLVEQHTPLTAPAIQVLELTRQSRGERQAASGSEKRDRSPLPTLIVGNPTMPKVNSEPLSPLPQAEKEANQIASLLKTTALVGHQATERRVVQQLPQAKLIHLATHGLLEYGQDMGETGVPGAIALAPAPPTRDGLLTSDEILGLRLNAELVVLSACDTGRGRITGDGVIGLSRAFISAGVPSIVVSLWAVSDVSTSHLMVSFYQNLQQHPDKARALRQAMLETMKSHPRPLDWAAFTLIGEAEGNAKLEIKN
ncbi:MAG: CHAT domain-containing protein [Leptolyngbyaceae cyanobacterium RU_5_1]|nr:CHAT domain-containing protein [Leptolyngbyaceae cyanobacterium RU_5_1]